MIGEPDADLFCMGDDMLVGKKIAVRTDDKTGAEAFRLAQIIFFVFGKEEMIKK